MEITWVVRATKNNKPKFFPSVRFYGNKTTYADLISRIIMRLNPKKFLETFGGTGVISYLLSDFCKTTYIDLLEFCCTWIRALTDKTEISWEKLKELAYVTPTHDIIGREFREMYFEDFQFSFHREYSSNFFKVRTTT